ncbi:MAG TPA: sterol desaturase family protein [Polyangiaceae bacterium]
MLNPVIEERIRNGQTCRMFKSDFFEWFSRIHPATPFVTYLPVIGYFFYRIGHRHDLSWPSAFGVVLLGLLMWTFAEYILHRYVFHFIRDQEWTKKVHFFLHGVHHDFPSDRDRLVMPLGASLPMALIFYTVFYFATGGVRFAEPLFIGFSFGYLCYDGGHYAIHHFKQPTRIGKFLKKHHMKHHHGDNFGGFGVSTPLWDLVLGTMPRIVKKSERAAAAKAA